MALDLSDYLSHQKPSTSQLDNTSGKDVLSAGQANLASSQQTFLTLLTTQLKNQDPTSPLDTNAFTQQLVQMTGVQQQLLSNQLLQQLVNANGNSDVKDAISLIGKTVTATSSDAVYKDGKATWNYNLGAPAADANLTITDSSGTVVWTGDAPDKAAGDHAFTWDGSGGSFTPVAGKTYTLTVKAKDASGADITTKTFVQGVVDSVRQGDSGALLSIGGSDVPLSGVTGVRAT